MIIQNTLPLVFNTNSQPSFQSKAIIVNNIKKSLLNLNKVGIGITEIIGGLLASKLSKQPTNFENAGN